MSEPRNAQQRADVIARLDRAFSPLITALGPAPERRSAPVSTRFSALGENLYRDFEVDDPTQGRRDPKSIVREGARVEADEQVDLS